MNEQVTPIITGPRNGEQAKPALDYFLYFLATSFLALISWNFFKRGEAAPGGAELLESLDPQPESRQRPNKQDAITSDRNCFAVEVSSCDLSKR